MYIRKGAALKYFAAFVLGTGLYCEWFIYLTQPWFWPQLECESTDISCIKILFVADPQIQGDLAALPPLNYLYNWDSDRYLSSTFSVALKYFKPDVVVYLGDLMDEGSISTMIQFHAYVKRLLNIFDINYSVVQVWLPGDNDIGGENEPIRAEKVEEFQRVFAQPPVVMFKNTSFYKVNGITHSFPHKVEGSIDNNFKIVVSHHPVTIRYVFGHQVNDEIRPNIYFCAHEHTSKYVQQTKELRYRKKFIFEREGDVLDISFIEDDLYEIYVPTCSYRMGTNRMGYGAAVVENSYKNMRYTVFWSPKRFPYLFFYLYLLIFFLITCALYCLARLLIVLCFRRSRSRYTRLLHWERI